MSAVEHGPSCDGTCGRPHGEMEAKQKSLCKEVTSMAEDQQRQWTAISDRVKWKILLPMVGIVSSIVIAVCGFFVLSMKESVADIKVGMEKNSSKLEVISEKLTEVQIDMARIRRDGQGCWEE